MTFINTLLAVFIGSVTGSFTAYLVQRYIFKKGLDNILDKTEEKIRKKIKDLLKKS